MKLRWERRGDDLHVTITGPLRWMQGGADPLTGLRSEVAAFARASKGRVVVDLAAVDQADPRSVFALLEALQPVREGGRITFQGRGSAIAAMVAGGQIPWFEPIEPAPGEDPAAGPNDPWEEMVKSIPERPPERKDIWGSAAKKIEQMLAACDPEESAHGRPPTGSPHAAPPGAAPPAARPPQGASAKPPTERILRDPLAHRPPPAAPRGAAPPSRPAPERPAAGMGTAGKGAAPAPGVSRDTVLPPRERSGKSGAGARGLTRREKRELEEAEERRRKAAEPRAPMVWFDEGLADPLAATPPGGIPPEGVPLSATPPAGLGAPPKTVSRAVRGVSPIDATPPEGQDVFEWFFAVGEQSVREGSERVKKSSALPAAPAAGARAVESVSHAPESPAAPAGPAPSMHRPAPPTAAAKPHLASPPAKGVSPPASPPSAEPPLGRPAYKVVPTAKLPGRESPAAPSKAPTGPPPKPPAVPSAPPPAKSAARPSSAAEDVESGAMFVDLTSRDFTESARFEPPAGSGGYGDLDEFPIVGKGAAKRPAAPAAPATPAAPAAPAKPTPPPALPPSPPLAPPKIQGWNADTLFSEFELRMAKSAAHSPPPAPPALAPSFREEPEESEIPDDDRDEPAEESADESAAELRDDAPALAPAFPAADERAAPAAPGGAPISAPDAARDPAHDDDDESDEQDDAHRAEDFTIDLELEQLYLSRNPSTKDLIDEDGTVHFNEEWKPLSPGSQVVRAEPRTHRPDPVELLLRAEEEAERRKLAAERPPPAPAMPSPVSPLAPSSFVPPAATPSAPPPRAPAAPLPPRGPAGAGASPFADPAALAPPAGRARPARAPIAHAAHDELSPPEPARPAPPPAARPPAAPVGPIGAFGSVGPSPGAGVLPFGAPAASQPVSHPMSQPASPPAPAKSPRSAPAPSSARPAPVAPPPRAPEPAPEAEDEPAARPGATPRGEAMLRGVAKMLHQYGETDRAREELESHCRRLEAESEERAREVAALRRELDELRQRAPAETPATPAAEPAVPGWLAGLSVPPTDPSPERARYGGVLSRFRASGTVDPEQVLLAIDALSRDAAGIAAAIGAHFERGDQNPGDGWRALLLVVSTLVREGADLERRRRAIRIAWLASLVRSAPGSDGDPVAVGPAVARLLSGRAYRFPGEEGIAIDPREADYDLALWRACARLDERRHLTPKRWRQSVGRTLATYEEDRAVRAGLARLIGSHSLYFPGTWVELTTGGIGPVIGAIPGRPELPRVLVLFRRNGRRGSRTPPQLFPAGDDSGAGVLRVLSRPHVAEEDANSLSMDTGGSIFQPKK